MNDGYWEDRDRLLTHGRMQFCTYTRQDPVVVGRACWRQMTSAAAGLDLVLSEPVMTAEEPDYCGGRYVTTTAAVSDAVR